MGVIIARGDGGGGGRGIFSSRNKRTRPLITPIVPIIPKLEALPNWMFVISTKVGNAYKRVLILAHMKNVIYYVNVFFVFG